MFLIILPRKAKDDTWSPITLVLLYFLVFIECVYKKKAIFGFRTRDERRHLQNPLLFDSGRRCGRFRARVCVCPASFNAVEVDFSQVFDEPLSSLKQVEIQRLRSAVV